MGQEEGEQVCSLCRFGGNGPCQRAQDPSGKVEKDKSLYRTDDPADPSSKRLTAQTLWIYSPGGTTEELPVVELHQGGGR